MSRVNKMFNPTFTYPEPTVTNRDGYGSYVPPIEEQTLQVLLANTMDNTFYADAKQLLKEAESVYKRMLSKDAVYFAKALAFARTEGFMRSQPVFGLAVLSEYNTDLFRSVFNKVILTPTDLKDFMTIVGARRNGSQGGRAIKEAVANWLSQKFGPECTFSEYWAIKYGADNEGMSLRDIIRTTHPSGMTPDIAKFLLNKEDYKVRKTITPKLYWYDKLKKADNAQDKIEAIEKGALPHEVASSFAGKDTDIWKAIVPNMPTFALLRNLNTLNRQGALDDFKSIIREKLSDANRIKKAKILPFRFYDAYKHLDVEWCRDLMKDCIDNSVDAIPDFKGNSAILLDISGSMVSFINTAALFAVAASRKGDNNKIVLFDTNAMNFPINKSNSVLTEALKIRVMGGTDTASPIRLLQQNKEKFDNIIMITDEQQNTGTPMYKAFQSYRNAINKNVKLFIIDVSTYRNASTPMDKNVYYIYGWGDQVLNFISATTHGWDTQVESVNGLDIFSKNVVKSQSRGKKVSRASKVKKTPVRKAAKKPVRKSKLR